MIFPALCSGSFSGLCNKQEWTGFIANYCVNNPNMTLCVVVLSDKSSYYGDITVLLCQMPVVLNTFSSKNSGTLRLLTLAALSISSLASSILPLLMSHLADSGINLVGIRQK